MKNNECIGVFDSGLGGLTAIKELKKCLPHENIVYFGDTGRVPYGSRSRETLIKYVTQDINFISSFSVKAILIACGTASAIALPQLEQELTTPTLGVVKSAARRGVLFTKNKKIGIIGTQGTIASGAYEQEVKKLDHTIETISVPCPLFVPLVENGRFYLNDPVVLTIAQEYLASIVAFGVDTLILGCTHYPLLLPIIQKIMGSEVNLVDPGFEGSHAIKTYLTTGGLCNPQKEVGTISYYVSDGIYGFSNLASIFLGEPIAASTIHKIDIEKY